MRNASIIKKIAKRFQKKEIFILTEEYQKCLEVLKNTDQNLFITGKAGTGKSSFIQYFRQNTNKKVVVLAPTGIAALNCHGQTIHSFFGFPPRMINLAAIRKNPNNRVFADLDCLVIDEISMVRADLLDGIDKFLRLNGKDSGLPFGGIQVVFVGDLYQLPPVVTHEEFDLYSSSYDSPYFFSANSFSLDRFQVIELETIFRQNDKTFIDFLNKIRTGETSKEIFDLINQKVVSGSFDKKRHIVLCATNKVTDDLNMAKLETIKKPLFVFKAEVDGNFPTEDRTLPVDLELKLKIGARVLFVKNDLRRRWVNGTLGNIHKLGGNLIKVQIDSTGEIVEVEQEEWDNIRYDYDEKIGGLKETVIGTLHQYPLRLAWAITIHRSQGMTLDKVCLDFSRSPFAHGQTYVALSRCRSLEGLILTRRIWPNDIVIDDRIVEFHNKLLKQK
ncbi:MAG: DEAD/DEAH box helicase [bacterium]|nr:DEAD/DEAH box helicase [bacterium]